MKYGRVHIAMNFQNYLMNNRKTIIYMLTFRLLKHIGSSLVIQLFLGTYCHKETLDKRYFHDSTLGKERSTEILNLLPPIYYTTSENKLQRHCIFPAISCFGNHVWCRYNPFELVNFSYFRKKQNTKNMNLYNMNKILRSQLAYFVKLFL